MAAGGEPFGSPGGDPTYAGGVPGELLGDLGRKPWSDYRQNEEKVLFSVIFFGVSRLLAQGLKVPLGVNSPECVDGNDKKVKPYSWLYSTRSNSLQTTSNLRFLLTTSSRNYWQSFEQPLFTGDT